MKSYILLLSLLTLVTSCDAPQRTRAPGIYDNGLSSGNNNTSGQLPPSNSTTGAIGGGGTTGSATGSPGYDNCDLSYKYHTVDTGHFGLCQNSSDETLFKFKSSLGSTSVRTCLIPTFKDSSGSSTYIGQPQCTYTTTDKVVEGRLSKTRSGYSGYPLNGVIVMKEPLLPEYFNCMQAYLNYRTPSCPYGGNTSPTCDYQAKNYMASVCTSFKTKYSNSYIDIRTK